YYHVEIPRAQPVDVLGNVDTAQLHVNPQGRQVALEGQQYPLEIGLDQQELEAQRYTLGVDQLVVLDSPAGPLQQFIGLAPQLADIATAVALGRNVGAVEHRLGQLFAQWFQ